MEVGKKNWLEIFTPLFIKTVADGIVLVINDYRKKTIPIEKIKETCWLLLQDMGIEAFQRTKTEMESLGIADQLPKIEDMNFAKMLLTKFITNENNFRTDLLAGNKENTDLAEIFFQLVTDIGMLGRLQDGIVSVYEGIPLVISPVSTRTRPAWMDDWPSDYTTLSVSSVWWHLVRATFGPLGHALIRLTYEEGVDVTWKECKKSALYTKHVVSRICTDKNVRRNFITLWPYMIQLIRKHGIYSPEFWKDETMVNRLQEIFLTTVVPVGIEAAYVEAGKLAEQERIDETIREQHMLEKMTPSIQMEMESETDPTSCLYQSTEDKIAQLKRELDVLTQQVRV